MNRVDTRSITPGVSILTCYFSSVAYEIGAGNIRLAFEVFHNIQELIIDIWMVHESDLDLI